MLIRIIIGFAIIVSLLSCSNQPTAIKAPDFVVQTLDGENYDSEELKGQITVVDFWATWCAPCIKEMPDYNALYKKLKSDKFEMVGITLASGDAKTVKNFIKNLTINYPIYMGNDKVAADFGGIVAFPTTFIIDQNWNIVQKYVGGGKVKIDEIELIVEALLKKS